MIIYLVRHGESVTNVEKITAGITDAKLSPHGMIQAQKVGQRFKYITDFDVIYTSDLQRAHNTAKAIHEFHKDKPCIVDERIREKHFGIFEGKSFDYSKEQNIGRPLHWNPQGGESFEDLVHRVRGFMIEILEKKEDCVIVSHGLTIKAILYILRAMEDEEEIFKLVSKNTAVYKVKVHPNKTELLLLNCIQHLEEM